MSEGWDRVATSWWLELVGVGGGPELWLEPKLESREGK